MKLLRHLPNALTCGNLLCGCFGILFATTNQLENAAYCVWAACVFDFFDGFAARMLNVSSPIGKELDSLADMVSFGVLPSLVMYSLLSFSTSSPFTSYLAFSITVFSALRLAKFNIDERQHDSFIGLPTPANALFISSLVFLPSEFKWLLQLPIFLVSITLIFSFLLVSEVALFALKFKNFSWRDNKVKFLFLATSIVATALLKAGALPFIILFYIAISLVVRVLRISQ